MHAEAHITTELVVTLSHLEPSVYWANEENKKEKEGDKIYNDDFAVAYEAKTGFSILLRHDL